MPHLKQAEEFASFITHVLTALRTCVMARILVVSPMRGLNAPIAILKCDVPHRSSLWHLDTAMRVKHVHLLEQSSSSQSQKVFTKRKS